MTDLDNTQIIAADESLLQNSSTIDTVCLLLLKKRSSKFSQNFSRKLH
jgi:hypothetical protein